MACGLHLLCVCSLRDKRRSEIEEQWTACWRRLQSRVNCVKPLLRQGVCVCVCHNVYVLVFYIRSIGADTAELSLVQRKRPSDSKTRSELSLWSQSLKKKKSYSKSMCHHRHVHVLCFCNDLFSGVSIPLRVLIQMHPSAQTSEHVTDDRTAAKGVNNMKHPSNQESSYVLFHATAFPVFPTGFSQQWHIYLSVYHQLSAPSQFSGLEYHDPFFLFPAVTFNINGSNVSYCSKQGSLRLCLSPFGWGGLLAWSRLTVSSAVARIRMDDFNSISSHCPACDRRGQWKERPRLC